MAKEKEPLLQERIDSLGFGFAQLKAVIIGGGVYIADGAEMLVISTVSDAVAEDWGLNSGQKGFIASVVFIGVLIGNITSGPIADRWGRKDIVIMSYFGFFIFCILSGWSVNMAMLCITRLLVGFFFGVGQPAWNALGAELTPTKWRMIMQVLGAFLFCVGEVYTCFLLMLDDPTLKHIRWQRLVQLAAIPSGVEAILSLFFLNQSPSYLVLQDRKPEALQVLDSIRRDNGMKEHPITFRVAMSPDELPRESRRTSRALTWRNKKDAFYQFRIIFGPQLRVTTAVTIFSCFTLNFIYYGTMYAFPQVFARQASHSVSGAMELLIGSFWEVGGFACAAVACNFVPRLRGMSLYLVLEIVFLLMFTLGNSSDQQVVMTIGFYGIKLVTNVGFVYVYAYSIEVYPTVARTTGHAICLGAGRLASIFTSLIYESLYARTHHSYAFFWVLIGVGIANLMSMYFLTTETMGMALKDTLDDEAPCEFEKEIERESKTLIDEDEFARKVAMMPEPFIAR